MMRADSDGASAHGFGSCWAISDRMPRGTIKQDITVKSIFSAAKEYSLCRLEERWLKSQSTVQTLHGSKFENFLWQVGLSVHREGQWLSHLQPRIAFSLKRCFAVEATASTQVLQVQKPQNISERSSSMENDKEESPEGAARGCSSRQVDDGDGRGCVGFLKRWMLLIIAMMVVVAVMMMA